MINSKDRQQQKWITSITMGGATRGEFGERPKYKRIVTGGDATSKCGCKLSDVARILPGVKAKGKKNNNRQ